MTNHLLQYYLKRNAFYKVSYSPIEYSPGLLLHYMCLCFFPLLFVLFHDMHTVIYTSCINLDEHAFDTGIEFWLSSNYVWSGYLQIMFGCSCASSLSLSHVCLYALYNLSLVLSCFCPMCISGVIE